MNDCSIGVPEALEEFKHSWDQFKHCWEDISHHGSIVWQCDWCKVYKSRSDSEYCPMAKECLNKIAKDKEMQERCEYASMKAKKDRFAYLESKYGNQNKERE